MKITLKLQYCDIENLGLGLAQAYGLFAGMAKVHPLLELVVAGHVQELKMAMLPLFDELTSQGIVPPNHPQAPAGTTPVQLTLERGSWDNLCQVISKSIRLMNRLLASLSEIHPAYTHTQQRLIAVTSYTQGFLEAYRVATMPSPADA